MSHNLIFMNKYKNNLSIFQKKARFFPIYSYYSFIFLGYDVISQQFFNIKNHFPLCWKMIFLY